MSWVQVFQSVITALVLAGIFALFRLFRDVDQLKISTQKDHDALKLQVEPVVTWYVKTSMDALKIATNPTSERLTNLADRYIASVKGDKSKVPLSVQEKQELIDGLREVMNDPKEYVSKRQSASMSLRFIETREGLTSHGVNH